MQEPVYAPNQWVAYDRGNGGGFGLIVGGDLSGGEWHYIVKGQSVERGSVRVKESDIRLVLDRQSWLTPVTQGSTAIYKDIKEA